MLDAAKAAYVCRSLLTIPYYPADQHEIILLAILEFVDDDIAHLKWLIRTAMIAWRKWEGIAELRALYATHFKPADGLPVPDSQTAGYTADDNEAAYQAAEAEETAKRIAQWKREAQQLPAAEQEANRQMTLEMVWSRKR